MHKLMNSPENPLDVAIFGGGVAGIYTAYRLLHHHPDRDNLDVQIFERSPRFGGRLWSQPHPDLPGVPIEFGGMGFSRVQQNVFGLCNKELGLPVQPFSAFNTVNLQFFRNVQFRYSDYADPEKIPFRLREDQQGKDPVAIVTDFLDKAIEGLKEKVETVTKELQSGHLEHATIAINELAAFLREARCTNRPDPIWTRGFWNEMLEVAGAEAHRLSLSASYSVSGYLNFNLYDAALAYYLGLFSFYFPATEENVPTPISHSPEHLETNIVEESPTSPPFYHVATGYQDLPLTMLRRFEERGGKIHPMAQLYTLEEKQHGGDTLLVAHIGPPNTHPLKALRRKFYCRNVVLAMPKRAIELLDTDCILFQSDQFRLDLGSVSGIPATKFFISYDEPWWKDPDGSSDDAPMCGYSTTDLPLKGTYYMPTAENGRGLLLASIADSGLVDFWDGYRPGDRVDLYDGPEFLKEQITALLRAPQPMIDEAQRQLAKLHGYEIPKARDAWYINWGENPFGGGWHSWNSNLRSWEVMPRIRRPLDDRNLFICGEAFSNFQGWVEGALNTAEMVCHEYLGVPRPDWVSPSYDFGP